MRVRWLAGPHAITLGAGWCVLGLLLIGALVRLAVALFGEAGLFLIVPLGFLALLLTLMAFFCGASGLVLWLVSLPSLWRPGRLWIKDALCIEHGRARTALPLVSVTGAQFLPDLSVLSLRTRDGDVVEASVDTHRDAQRLLDAIATGTVQGTWMASLYRSDDQPWWLASPPLAAAAIIALGTLTASAVTSPDVALAFGLALGISAMAWGALLNAAATQDCVVAGSDGLSIQEGSLSRFIGFTRITAVSETNLGLKLSLAGGEEVEVTLISPELLKKSASGVALSVALAERRRAHLLALIEAEIAPQEPHAIRAAALLERQGRSLDAWRAALGELLREASGDYRRATLSKDQATQVLEDGKAPPELRIGAALALSPGADAGTYARLRVAIETCVNPAVRIALTQASYGDLDEDTLDVALRSADAEAEMTPAAARPAAVGVRAPR